LVVDVRKEPWRWEKIWKLLEQSDLILPQENKSFWGNNYKAAALVAAQFVTIMNQFVHTLLCHLSPTWVFNKPPLELCSQLFIFFIYEWPNKVERLSLASLST
jgi:hypothetical protein